MCTIALLDKKHGYISTIDYLLPHPLRDRYPVAPVAPRCPTTDASIDTTGGIPTRDASFNGNPRLSLSRGA